MSNAVRRYVAATLIDALGSGLWMPFALLFLVNGQHLTLVNSGSALSAGALLGLAVGPLAGAGMDRFGPLALLIASNLMRLAAFAVYPLVHHSWQVIAVAAVVSAGDRLFWTINAPIVHELAPIATERLLGIQTVGRFAGAGVGAAVTAAVPNLTNPAIYHLLAYLNAGSFAIAAVLVMGLPVSARQQRRAESGDWATVLTARPYVALCATNIAFTLASAGKYTILPVLAINVLHTPHWVPGLAIGAGTLTLVIVQVPVTRLASRHRRDTGLITAALIFATGFGLFICLDHIPAPAAAGLMIGGACLLAVAEALFAPISTAAAAAAAPVTAQGRASALYQLSWAISTVAAPALLSTLLDAGNTWLWLTLVVTSATAIPAVRSLRHHLPGTVLGRRDPQPENPTSRKTATAS